MNGYLITCEKHENVFILSSKESHIEAINKYLETVLYYCVVDGSAKERYECISLVHKEGPVFNWKFSGYREGNEEYNGTITQVKTIA